MGAHRSIDSARHASRPGRSGAWFSSAVAAVCRHLGFWLARRRSRHALLDLTDEQLCDVGLTRRQALHEGYRPFWD